MKTQSIITVPTPCLGRPFALKITAARFLMGGETQTSGNSSWSTAGGLEEVAKKGLPILPVPPKVVSTKREKMKQGKQRIDGLGAERVLRGWESFC